ncbi:MAG: class I SAM-dependent methyltransferase [Acidobacteria bacterium]|nr:class I SAM-dependent methyltransferase [Acidobacteriota bacterium]
MSAPEPHPTPTAGWSDATQVAWYTERIGKLEARQAGERSLVEHLPPQPERILDLGCGDGRLTALAIEARPSIQQAITVDISPPMMALARARFASDSRVEVRAHDLNTPITDLGAFDLIVSGFAIHHLEDDRKKALFAEIANQLNRGGLFANLEVVRSATPRRHAEFLAAIGRTTDDPEDRLATIHDQLGWMRAARLTEVDCLWRWRGFALLLGESAAPAIP